MRRGSRRAVEVGTDLSVGEKKADGKDDEKEIKGQWHRFLLLSYAHMHLSIGRQRHPNPEDIRTCLVLRV